MWIPARLMCIAALDLNGCRKEEVPVTAVARAPAVFRLAGGSLCHAITR